MVLLDVRICGFQLVTTHNPTPDSEFATPAKPVVVAFAGRPRTFRSFLWHYGNSIKRLRMFGFTYILRMGNSLSKYRHLAAKSSVVEPGSQSDVRTPVKIPPSR